MYFYQITRSKFDVSRANGGIMRRTFIELLLNLFLKSRKVDEKFLI